MKTKLRQVFAWVFGLIAFVGLAHAQPAITNVSVKTFVSPSESAVVGFNISTKYEWETKTVLVRGVGPGLRDFGVSNRASVVSLSYLSKSDPRFLFTNANWQFGANASPEKSLATMRGIEALVGAFPLVQGSRDAAMVLELPAGTHTITVSAPVDAGVVLIEVYEIPNSQKG